MLTTKKILLEACEEFDLPYETVKANYDAWVIGLKNRLLAGNTLNLRVAKNLVLYYTSKVNIAENGGLRPSKEIVNSRKNRKLAVEKVIKRLEKTHSKRRSKKFVIYNNYPPLEYYGYNKGYSLTDLEEAQQRMFDKKNKYEY